MEKNKLTRLKIVGLVGLALSLYSTVGLSFFNMSFGSRNKTAEIVALNPGSISVGMNKIAYTTPGSYTFTMPPGFTRAEIFVLGGGGGGGHEFNDPYIISPGVGSASGGGGGGGGYYISTVVLTPGSSHPIEVAALTPVHTSNGNGQDGATSSFGTIAFGYGGDGGLFSTSLGSGGRGGSGSGSGGVAVEGGDGSSGGLGSQGGAGGGAACPTSNGKDGEIILLSANGNGGGGAGFSNAGLPSEGGQDIDGTAANGGCGGGTGGSGVGFDDATNSIGASNGRGVSTNGSTKQGGGGFGGGGGGSHSNTDDTNGGGGGSGLVWIRVF